MESIKGPVRLIHPLEGVGDVRVYLQLSLEIPLHENGDIRPAMTQPPNSTLSLTVSLSLSLSLSLARSLARALSLSVCIARSRAHTGTHNANTHTHKHTHKYTHT